MNSDTKSDNLVKEFYYLPYSCSYSYNGGKHMAKRKTVLLFSSNFYFALFHLHASYPTMPRRQMGIQVSF